MCLMKSENTQPERPDKRIFTAGDYVNIPSLARWRHSRRGLETPGLTVETEPGTVNEKASLTHTVELILLLPWHM